MRDFNQSSKLIEDVKNRQNKSLNTNLNLDFKHCQTDTWKLLWNKYKTQSKKQHTDRFFAFKEYLAYVSVISIILFIFQDYTCSLKIQIKFCQYLLSPTSDKRIYFCVYYIYTIYLPCIHSACILYTSYTFKKNMFAFVGVVHENRLSCFLWSK